ncbi:uncharacterized protein [Scyliorhinus torazame]|uniref:uncharacterized protein n=1 Tax=Scyliorhinus torazame TaxID=75743 RepID=UPI003B596340
MPSEMKTLLLILGCLNCCHFLSADPCVNHKVLEQPWRSTNCGKTNCSSLQCDKSLVTGWYRFNGPGGSTIPEAVVPVNHCSTHAPGWLRGRHPTPGDGEVKRQVCFHWNGKSCRWSQDIKIKRCRNYFVYYLKKSPACHLAYCTAGQSKPVDPCVSHQVLNQRWRSTKCVGRKCSSLHCDNNLVPGWYRFNSPGGSTIPEAVVPVNHCSTSAPGWLRGRHPTPGDGEVKRQVCFHWSGNSCRWSQDIKIKRCRNYFVYYLKKTPVCHLAYCTAGQSKPVDPCVSHQVLNQRWRSTKCVGRKCSSLHCDNKLVPGWYRFNSPGGSTIPEAVVPVNHCSTSAPGWLRGRHPTPGDGEVKRQVCFHWSGNSCRWSQDIKIKRCRNYFVYYLKKSPACHLAYCTAGQSKPVDPCVSHQVLNQRWRSTKCVGRKCSRLHCDNKLVPGWYRFNSPGGSTIPEAVVPVNHCSTSAPGWLRGRHPTPGDGEVKRQVCFHWSGNSCRWSQDIKIKRCRNYFVYYLKKSPACHLAYCTAGQSKPVDPCVSHQVLNQRWRSTKCVGRKCSRLHCDNKLVPGWYRFNSPGGSTIPEAVVPVNHCSTSAPGWLRGRHPTPGDGEVKRQVCFHWSGNSCRWSQDIKIKRCRNYFVYYLKKSPACHLAYCTAGQSKPVDPCVSHQVLNQRWRSTKCVGRKCSRLHCDNKLVPGWYRFNSPGGSTIPEAVVPVNHCSTSAPGWLRGRHPTPGDGEVKRTVCFHWSGNSCRWSQDIKIKRCRNYFVYYLKKSPACHLAYCTAGQSKPVDPCVSHQVLNQRWRSTKCVGRKCSRLHCDNKLVPGWYRFNSPGGSTIPEAVVPVNHCSTSAPGWLRGRHPTPGDGEVKRQVCFHWSGNSCRWSQDIKIKRCRNYFVYYLKKSPVCHLAYCTAGQSKPVDPCVSHQVLNQRWRSTKCVGRKCSRLHCDNKLVPGWYRFNSPGGSTIPEAVVPVNHCSTSAPGWLRGRHPTPGDGEVKRQVCFHWSGNSCRWSQDIKIKRCRNYFVYYLKKSPACHLAYCTAGQSKPVDPCVSHQVLNQRWRSTKCVGRKCSRLHCDNKLVPGWYRFNSPGGSTIPEAVVPVNHCSTSAPGWLRGRHPTPGDGEVKRQVCFHWSGNSCRWSQDIKIKRCRNYFVYYLKKSPVCHLAYCTAGQSKPVDPCVSHQVLNQRWRSTKCVGRKCSRLHCDNKLVPGWYRFNSPGGSTIPEAVVPVNHCSTSAPGWLRGRHPTPGDGEVKRQVCFHWSGNSCRWSQDIKIKRCRNYFVYYLKKSPACHLAYCTAGQSKPVDPCVSHQVLNQRWRSTKCVGRKCSSLHCDNNLVPGWYRFNSPGGSTIPEAVVPVNHCSTHAPGWLNGSHPTPGDGEVKRQVCFHWNGKSCRWSQDIKIKRCRNYFVYYLKKSPVCHLAYCTGEAVIPTLPTTPKPTLPQIASSMIVPNLTSPAPGMGGKQFQLVITLLGDFDPDSMRKFILELQLSFRERFPDLKLHLSLGES